VRLALRTGQPFRDLVTFWEPEDVASALEYLEDEQDAERDAMRRSA
jgi:hypothetical protein